MNFIESGYCRLCGELKICDQLINIQENTVACEEIMRKLVRVNAGVDISSEILPKTVCIICVNSLKAAFEFVNMIERVQDYLCKIFLGKHTKVDKAIVPSEDVEPISFSPTFMTIKVEPQDVAPSEELLEQSESRNESESEQECYPMSAATHEVKPITLSPTIKIIKIESKDVVPEESMKKSKSKNESELHRGTRPASAAPKKGSKKISLRDTAPETLEQTWRDYNWKCSYCESLFPTLNELRSHSMQNHQSCNAFKCTDCTRRYSSLIPFTQHVKRHHQYLKFSCHLCFQPFTSHNDTRTHLSHHAKEGYICRGCFNKCNSKSELDVHTNTYSKSVQRRSFKDLMKHTDNLTCLFCQKTLVSKACLRSHLLTHTERKRDHMCDTCGKGFLCKTSLANHMVLHEDTRPFQCLICKASFKTLTVLRKHTDTHNTTKEFACEQCGRCFKNKRLLATHRLIHTDTLPHECQYCNKAFLVKKRLVLHLRQHTGEKPYKCDTCERNFTHWSNYNKHMKEKHSINIAKRKHTAEGVLPIDPQSGQILIPQQTEETMEWKRALMKSRRKERKPRAAHSTSTVVGDRVSDGIVQNTVNECQN